MAIEKVDVGISDADMFRSAMADEPKSEPEQVQTEERNRDELGRFAPKQEDADAAPIQQQPVEQPAQPTPDKEEAQVPSWRLRELREQREAAETRARDLEARYNRIEQDHANLRRQWEQSQQPKQEPVDFFANPDEALNQRVAPIESRFEQLASKLVLRASKAEAMAAHGVATVQEMEQAIGKAMQEGHPEMQSLSVRMRNSDDPVGVAMNWYKQDKLLRETGGDLTNYRSKLEGDLLKDPAFLAKALDAAKAQAGQSGNPPKINIPPSLNRASGSAGNGNEPSGGLDNESQWEASRPVPRGRK